MVSRVLTKIKEKLGKVDLRKGANLRLLLQPPEEFLGPLNGPRGRPYRSLGGSNAKIANLNFTFLTVLGQSGENGPLTSDQF